RIEIDDEDPLAHLGEGRPEGGDGGGLCDSTLLVGQGDDRGLRGLASRHGPSLSSHRWATQRWSSPSQLPSAGYGTTACGVRTKDPSRGMPAPAQPRPTASCHCRSWSRTKLCP